MADRFPLILNTNANQIQEIASGDTLDLTGTNIKSAGIVTAAIFSGPIVAGAGVSNITAGIGTYTDLRVGGDTTFSEDFVVTGNARVTGILTVGTSSIILNDSTDTIKVGTALTLGHTQGVQFHTQNLHSAGFEVNQINASGIITATEADINGDLDVEGHTNLDNVSIAGVTTFSTHSLHVGIARFNQTIVGTARTAIKLTCADESTDTTTYPLFVAAPTGDQFPKTGTNLTFNSASGLLAATQLSGTIQTAAQPNITSVGTLSSLNVSGNVSIGGTLTYEDVTNIDSVGIITARSSIKLDADGSTSSNFLSIGADDDLKIFHQSNVDKIESSANGFHIRQINGGDLHIHAGANTGSANNRLVARAGGKAELYYAGALKLSTETGGVNITGVCTATTFVGNLTGTASKVNLTSNNDNTLFRVPFTSANTGSVDLYSDTNSGMTYNPSTGLLYIAGTMEASTLQGALNATTGSFSGDVTFSGGATACLIAAGSDIRFNTGNWTGEGVKIQYHSNKFYWQSGANGWQFRDSAGAAVLEIAPGGACSGKNLTFSQDIAFGGGAGAVYVNGGSDIRIAAGTWTGEYTGGIKIQPDGSNSYVQYQGNLYLRDVTAANRFLINQGGEAYITSTADGLLNLNTSSSNGAFMRFRKPSSSDTSLHVGVAKALAAGSDNDDGAVYAGRGNLILRASSGVISFTDGGAATSGIDIVTRGGGSSGNDANNLTSPFIRFRDYPAGSYFNSTTTDDNNWAIGADDSGVSEFKIVYGGGANSNRITSIQENSQTGTTVMGFQSDLQVTTTGFKVTETADTSGTSSVGGSTRNQHYDATPGRGTYLVHGHITYRDNAPGGPDPDQVRLVLQVDGSDIAHASILDEDSNNTARNQEDSFTALITVNGSQNVQVETYTTDPADAGGADYRYRINIYKLGG